MEIYQGEPIGFMLKIKNDDGTYVPSLEGYSLEALLSDQYKNIVGRWKTEDGSMWVGVHDGKGYAAFAMDGDATAALRPDKYTLEMARVISHGRAIGILKCIVNVKPALIRRGV